LAMIGLSRADGPSTGVGARCGQRACSAHTQSSANRELFGGRASILSSTGVGTTRARSGYEAKGSIRHVQSWVFHPGKPAGIRFSGFRGMIRPRHPPSVCATKRATPTFALAPKLEPHFRVYGILRRKQRQRRGYRQGREKLGYSCSRSWWAGPTSSVCGGAREGS